MEYNSGSIRTSDFKSAELYDTKSYYQLTVSILKCEKLFKSAVEERLSKSKENISEKSS